MEEEESENPKSVCGKVGGLGTCSYAFFLQGRFSSIRIIPRPFKPPQPDHLPMREKNQFRFFCCCCYIGVSDYCASFLKGLAVSCLRQKCPVVSETLVKQQVVVLQVRKLRHIAINLFSVFCHLKN